MEEKMKLFLANSPLSGNQKEELLNIIDNIHNGDNPTSERLSLFFANTPLSDSQKENLIKIIYENIA